LVVCLLEDALSKGERTLVALGKQDAVLQIRHTFQDAMEADAISLVSELTGRSVVAFMSTNHADPDYAVEIFVLDAEIDRASTPL
ncbi:MAG TPA: Na-translocating system protein MpsC family protein, partial [Gaiellales bacterium]